MPKVIQPRRSNKNVSVEDYWATREQFTKQTVDKVHVYRDQEVTRRYRHTRISEQVLTFNPLLYFLTKKMEPPTIHKTHTHEYMESIYYRVPEDLVPVKRMIFGLASILQNIDKIYAILWEHLEYDDTWRLMQTLLADTRGQSYQSWINVGLIKIVEKLDTNYQETKFRNIFNTLCIFMEVNFAKISQSVPTLVAFLSVIHQNYANHVNKYMRKFSVKALSYVLSNLEDQQFRDLLTHIMQDSTEQNKLKGFLSDLLANRLKYSSGCLTPNSAEELFSLVNWLASFSQNLDHEIMENFLTKLFSNLDIKKAKDEKQTLFDFDDILKAFIELVKQERVKSDAVIKGIVEYLEQPLPKGKRRQFSSDLGQMVGQFLWSVLPGLAHNESIYSLLTMSLQYPLTDLANIKNYLQQETDVGNVNLVLSRIEEKLPSKDTGSVLLLSFRKWISLFCTAPQQSISQTHIQVVYRLAMMLDQMGINANFDKIIDTEINAFVTHINRITDSIPQQNSLSAISPFQYQYSLVLFRLLSVTNMQQSQKQILLNAVQQLSQRLLSKYSQNLQVQLDRNKDKCIEGIFSCKRHVQSLFVYSHSEIPTLLQGINILQALIILQKKINPNSNQLFFNSQHGQKQLKNWHKISINRSALCSQINQLIDNENQRAQNLIFSLKSRHRLVRLETLKYLIKKGVFSGHEQIGQYLVQIDSDIIDLETERQVKRSLLELERYIRVNQLSIGLNQLLICWSLGFAFTGFKLIQQSFTRFLSVLCQTQDNIQLGSLINFLEYYTFRNSRVFQDQTKQFFSSAYEVQLPQNFNNLCHKDFKISQLESAEFIGIDRIASAISSSETMKKKLGKPLQQLIQAYFSEEFVRGKQNLRSGNHTYMDENGEINQLVLPPKTTFLKQILKLLPNNYTPPLECVHYCSEVLTQGSFAVTKRQEWELLWDKKKKKDQSRIKFQQMSHQEKQLYCHYLWGLALKADANRIRIILEHVRQNMPQMVDYFMNIYYAELTLGETQKDKIEHIFKMMDSRKLLTFIYILKAVTKTLRNYVRQNVDKINSLIIQIINTFQSSQGQAKNEMIDEQQEAMENEGMDEEINEVQEEDADEQVQVVEQTKNRSFSYVKYKNHRKELYKVLNSFIEFTADYLETSTIAQILNAFANQGKIKALANAALASTPGLLLFLSKLSYHWKFHPLLYENGLMHQLSTIISNGHCENKNNSVSACVQILKNILGVVDEEQMVDEGDWLQQNIRQIKQYSVQFLESFRNFLSTRDKKDVLKPELQTQILKIILKLMQIGESGLPAEWGTFFWTQLQRITRQKSVSEKQNDKLRLILEICMEFSIKLRIVSADDSNTFLLKMIGIIPHLKDVDHRRLISEQLMKDSESEGRLISKTTAQIVTSINTTIKDSISKQIDYPMFFEGINMYKNGINDFSVHEHQYIIYNTLPYLTNQELSVRKAVNSCVTQFLKVMDQQNRLMVATLFRAVTEYFKKPIEGGEQVFWSIGSCVALFVRWVVFRDNREQKQKYHIFNGFVSQNEEEKDVFELLAALSQAKKLQGLKLLKQMLGKYEIVIQNGYGDRYPNIIGSIVVPMLEYFILPQPIAPGAQYSITNNLSSTLTHVSLEVYEIAMLRGGQSLQKRQLKRLVSKIKFSDVNLKKNILIIKIIGQIIQSINLPKSTQLIKKTIQQSGFDEFHKKILEKQSNFSKMRDNQEDSDQEEEAKRQAFARINDQVEDEQVININYLNFDKKLMQAEQDTQKKEQGDLVRFLKMNVLAPLKTMLMYENRSEKNAKEETDKSRISLSVVVTKIIVKFPLDTFLNQMQKILSKLGRLLKKKQVEVREKSRKCLAEICKLVGPEMLYMLARELKFHLRDNFQQHILNYTVYFILEKVGQMKPGALDHCLPILLPPIIDQIFGKTALEKEMVDEHQIKTINMQSKKKKGYELLVIICKQISVSKVSYLIQYFQKFLKQYMNTEANLNKYDQMLTNLISGFSKNQQLLQSQHTTIFLQLLSKSIEDLKAEIKLYKFDTEGPKHESTIKQKNEVGKKVGLKETYELQEEAGRNKSIFKKQTKVLQERRNHDILVNSFMQLHLSLLGLLIRKKVFSIDSIQNDQTVQAKFISITNFVIQCIDHRDNRLVRQCLKIIHAVIHWEKMTGIAQMRKKVCRKIFVLIQKLTGSDEDLLRECFVLLNDLFVQVTITKEVLPTLLSIIKLHITGSEHGILEEPFRLFKTVLHKISGTALMVEDGVQDLYELVRITMINTTLDQIRGICRSICLIFIRQQIPIDGNKNAKSRINLQQMISFYLNNLDCKYTDSQLCILDILEEYTLVHPKQELEQTGQVIVMSLGTAYANDPQNETKFVAIIEKIVNKIDKGKSISLMEKCLVWMSNTDNELICKCGYFMLHSIMNSLKDGSMPKNMLQKTIRICTQTLKNQQQKLEIYYEDKKQNAIQRQSIKNNPQWAAIIQTQEAFFEVNPNFTKAISILSNLFPKLNQIDISKITQILWHLLTAPSHSIFVQVSHFLLMVKKIVPMVGTSIMSQQKGESKSLRNKIILMMSSVEADDANIACQVLKKVLLELQGEQTLINGVKLLVQALVNKIGRCILNLKKFEKQMIVGLEFLKHFLSISPQIQEFIFRDEKLVNDIFWNLSKISRNQLVEIHVKEKNQEAMEIIKQKMGEAEFFRKLANTEAMRKQKKNQQKVNMARLAVIDQAAFEQAKARKKHKKG